jgi:transposase-like protein
VIVTCVRWYLRVCLSLRDLQELKAERGLVVHDTSIWRWIQVYGPEISRRLHGEVKRKSSTWHIDETSVRIAGKWMYLFRAVDSHGQTVDFYLSETRDREGAKQLLHRALANPDNQLPLVFAQDGKTATASDYYPTDRRRNTSRAQLIQPTFSCGSASMERSSNSSSRPERTLRIVRSCTVSRAKQRSSVHSSMTRNLFERLGNLLR